MGHWTLAVVLLEWAIALPANAATFRGLGAGSSYASCVSGDGHVVAGYGSVGSGYRWTAEGGLVALDFVPHDCSYDGSVIVGTRGFGDAVRWTEATGGVGLGDFTPGNGNAYSFALGVSADGSIVVGLWQIRRETP
jgi:uncharacterized membrane protein